MRMREGGREGERERRREREGGEREREREKETERKRVGERKKVVGDIILSLGCTVASLQG